MFTSPRRQASDACPGALQVHQAADGGLVRVRLPGGALSAAQLGVLAAAAASPGDGALELTSRGNVQVRGLAPGAHIPLAARLRSAGLLPSATHELVRNIVASVLSGRDTRGYADIRPLVTDLDAGLCAAADLAGLPGRFLFSVDDGRGDVAVLAADVGLHMIGPEAVALVLSGRPSGLVVRLAGAVRMALAASRAFLAERAGQNSAAWRLAELNDPVTRIGGRVTTALGPAVLDLAALDSPAMAGSWPPGSWPPGSWPPGSWPPDGPSGPPTAGPTVQRDGRLALTIVVPLGRLMTAQADLIGEAATVDGGGDVLVTPWRTVVVPDLRADAARRWAAKFGAAGLVVTAGSGWVGVSACAGRPGCAHARADVRTDAATQVTVHAGPPDGDRSDDGSGPRRDDQPVASGPSAVAGLPVAPGLPVHWVGCERRCGRPAGRHVEVLATTDGYQIRRDGELVAVDRDLGRIAAAVAAARRGA